MSLAKFGLLIGNATAAGSPSSLFNWWQLLSSMGPKFGYFPNASKAVLIVKPEYFVIAQSVFANTNIHVTTQGQQYLDAALQTRSFAEGYV